MILVLLLSAVFQAAPARLQVDLDGDGQPETIIATPRGHKVRFEVQNASGKRVARADAPAPESGVSEVSLTAGSLGSAGALLQVSARSTDQECHTIWRLNGGALSPLPLISAKGRLPDCSAHEGWTDRWEKPRPDSPADYVRERARSTPRGEHHRVEVYRFAGFDLRFDPARSSADIGGVVIPDWSPAVLYPKPLQETLVSCFDLSAFKSVSLLQILADPDAGTFSLAIERPSGREELPITASSRGTEKEEWTLTAGSGERSGHLRVQLASDHHTPLEVRAEGLGSDLNRVYAPITLLTARGIELFFTAEDELALRALAGSWESKRGERIEVNPVSTAPPFIEFGGERVGLSIARAPRGSDVLLIPGDGSAAKTALLLRGPNVFARLPVECGSGQASTRQACRITGSGEIFHRLGAQINTR